TSNIWSSRRRFAQKGGLEIKNRKSNRFNSMVEPPWYALSDFYRTAINQKSDKLGTRLSDEINDSSFAEKLLSDSNI
ncbi:MAG: hypothetical protein SOX65_04850, partial [Porphyromonas sp.]|uniref:hypothetical protein n=1 Tax=Porphyromonas sp. TaxID=1924944 RepID=UPI002A81D7DF